MYKYHKVKWFFDIKDKKDDVELLFLDEDTVKSIRCPPTLADINGNGNKEVIVGSDAGVLHVIGHDGKLLWDFKTGGVIRSSAFVYDITKNHD